MGKPSSDCFVSAIAPLHNDGTVLTAYVTEVMAVLRAHYDNYELILIDDGSEDTTPAIASELLDRYECVRFLKLSCHCGAEVAISCGLDTAIGDFVVVMLPNTDPPQAIPSLIERCRGGQDILIGTRQERNGEPIWLQWGAAAFYWVSEHLFSIPLTRNATQFRVLSRQVVNALARVPDKSRYLRLLGNYTGYKSETFTYEPLQRVDKERTHDLWESLAAGLQIIFVNSTNLLRLLGLLGLLVALANFGTAIATLLAVLATGFVWHGWQIVVLAFCTNVGVLTLTMAVLCQYVSLIYGKSREWADYYVTDERNSAVLIADSERRNIVEVSQE